MRLRCAFHTASLDDLFLDIAQPLKRPLGIAQFDPVILGSIERRFDSIGFKLHFDHALFALATIEEEIAQDCRQPSYQIGAGLKLMLSRESS
jgi:hypothetical protein